MQFMWSVQIEDILEAQELARSRGKKPGESYEVEFLEVMEKKGKKPIGATELSRTEMIAEQVSHGKSVMSIEIDNEGKQTIKVAKPKEI